MVGAGGTPRFKGSDSEADRTAGGTWFGWCILVYVGLVGCSSPLLWVLCLGQINYCIDLTSSLAVSLVLGISLVTICLIASTSCLDCRTDGLRTTDHRSHDWTEGLWHTPEAA